MMALLVKSMLPVFRNISEDKKRYPFSTNLSICSFSFFFSES